LVQEPELTLVLVCYLGFCSFAVQSGNQGGF